MLPRSLTVLVSYSAIESLIALDQIKHASEILLPYFLNARKPGPDSRDAHPIYPSGKPKCDDSSQSVGDILLAECDNISIYNDDDESQQTYITCRTTQDNTEATDHYPDSSDEMDTSTE